ncbi:serine hydrolase domain-containing protein [Corynebacterium lizhenjunii]|uniref:serine hydrolase domain-containing protein n=1 Tax=Corynebacterium lizhenjunii TaxID=2709394 RepID=UPI0013EC7C13|nr:serine hydrolase domain-containing protein [Corynebacterium lizhenjunii]
MSAFDTAADYIAQVLPEFPADAVAGALISHEQVRAVGDTAAQFAVASVTKPVVAYGVMMAVEEGAVELDQPAGPEGASLRHLLAHASGVGFDSREPERPVEQRRIYSSAGYEWAAEVVEEATGMSFASYLAEGVFAPLGMENTALRGPAGHGLETTVDDLVRFSQEVMQPRLLDPSTVAEMVRVQFAGLRGIVPGYGPFVDNTWGLGFEVHGSKGRDGGREHWMSKLPADAVGHFGMSGTYLWMVPGAQAAMVMLSNRDFGDWAKPLWAEVNARVARELGLA